MGQQLWRNQASSEVEPCQRYGGQVGGLRWYIVVVKASALFAACAAVAGGFQGGGEGHYSKLFFSRLRVHLRGLHRHPDFLGLPRTT